MDTILNMKTFALVCRLRSFAATARELEVSPSVVTKRVRQLEDQVDARLLNRSTRHVSLTEAGEHYLRRIQAILSDYDELVQGIDQGLAEPAGHVRIKAPETITQRLLHKVFLEVQRQYPRITLEVVVLDRSANPVEEGFDISIGVLNATYDNVLTYTYQAYETVICASPAYLEQNGIPRHPEDLVDHDCLVFSPGGSTWGFEGPAGTISVNVHPKFSSNNAQLTVSMARNGAGIGRFSRYAAQPSLDSGALRQVLMDYRSRMLSLKAFVPETKAKLRRVQLLLQHIEGALAGSAQS